jgi:predicted RNase H-like HicB family nuclease
MGYNTYYHNAEKIEEALKEIKKLIKFYVEHKVAMKEGRADESIRDLEGIRKILEK